MFVVMAVMLLSLKNISVSGGNLFSLISCRRGRKHLFDWLNSSAVIYKSTQRSQNAKYIFNLVYPKHILIFRLVFQSVI